MKTTSFILFLYCLFSGVIISQNCEIGPIILDISCVNDTIKSKINFDYTHTSDSFKVKGNGIDYGHFGYNQLPISLQSDNTDQSHIEYVISDLTHSECSNFIDKRNPCICSISDLRYETGECNDDGTFPLILKFEYENIGDQEKFDVYDRGGYVGSYKLAELPLKIEKFKNYPDFSHQLIKVCINDKDDCCVLEEFEKVCQPTECSISNLRFERGECNDDGTFPLILKFEYENVGDQEKFDVYDRGGYVGSYKLAELPLKIEKFKNYPDFSHQLIKVCINDKEDCCVLEEFEKVCEPEECSISNLRFETGDCNDNGTFPLILKFEYENIGDQEKFDVYDRGGYVGSYKLAELPLKIEKFKNYPDFDYQLIKVCINDKEDCCVLEEFEKVCKPKECSISNLRFETGECNDDGAFPLILKFEYENVGEQEKFDVYDRGGYVGSYKLAELPLKIEKFKNYPDFSHQLIKVCINDKEDCCVLEEFEKVCEPEECSISNLRFETGDCNDNGTFPLILKFEYENIGDQEKFDVYDRGGYVGSYKLAELPLKIEKFKNYPDFDYQLIKVCINDKEDCCVLEEFEKVCKPKECSISNLRFETGECNDDGAFPLILKFEYENVGEQEKFDVYDRGGYVGSYKLAELPLKIEKFKNYPDFSHQLIKVCINDKEDCCVLEEFEKVCEPEKCSISDLDIEIGVCSSENTYPIKIDFNVNPNNQSEKFDVYGRNGYFETYKLKDLPILIDNFPYNPEFESQLIKVCVSDDGSDNCCTAKEYKVDCENLCAIKDIEIETLDCSSRNEYEIILNFVPHNFETDSFNVVVNGVVFGCYHTSSLPLTLGSFQTGKPFELMIQGKGDLCQAEKEFRVINCNSFTETPIELFSYSTFDRSLQIRALEDFQEIRVTNILGQHLYVKQKIKKGDFYRIDRLRSSEIIFISASGNGVGMTKKIILPK